MFAKAQPLAAAGAVSLLTFLASACGRSAEGADDPLPDIVYCSGTTDD